MPKLKVRDALEEKERDDVGQCESCSDLAMDGYKFCRSCNDYWKNDAMDGVDWGWSGN